MMFDRFIIEAFDVRYRRMYPFEFRWFNDRAIKKGYLPKNFYEIFDRVAHKMHGACENWHTVVRRGEDGGFDVK